MGNGFKISKGGVIIPDAPLIPDGALYWLGDERSSLSGGWVEETFGTTTHSLTKNTADMVLYLNTSSSGRGNAACISNSINFTAYSKVKALVDITNPAGKQIIFKISTGITASEVAATTITATSATDLVVEVNTMVVNSTYKLYVINYSDIAASGAITTTIKKVWLEV